ncbi:MAG: DUF3037 domain-containing protein [Thaumarchaeota archaeon]|nr:DUF3037 domain-containing protein [Nitrososphaerota archaeon]
MQTSTLTQIPCKYSIVKYVADEVRDEPINIGVVLQAKDNQFNNCQFITRFNKIRTAEEQPSFLKHVIEKIKHENSKELGINELANKYNGKIRLSLPRVTITNNLEKEVELLFNRFVSIEQESIKVVRPMTLRTVKHSVWNYFKKFEKPVKRNILIKGKNSKFVYDFVLDDDDDKHIIHSISYNALNALKATKLFDWSVRDVIEGNGYNKDNFGAVILEPQENHPKYEFVKEQFKEGKKILESQKYNLVTFDEDERWQKKIKQLV